MRTFRLILAITLAVSMIAGCGGGGGGSVATSGGAGGSTEEGGGGVATVIVQHLLARAVPAGVVNLRYAGLDSGDNLLFGPVTFPRQAETVLEEVPVEVTVLRVEYLGAGDVVLGVVEIPLTLEAGGSVTVEDPDWALLPQTLAITGPASLVAGNPPSAYTATAGNVDGGTADVSGTVAWTTSDANRATVDAAGNVTAVGAGLVTLTATASNGVQASFEVLVYARIALVDVDSSGTQANFFAVNPECSADGRLVAFGTTASNLVPGDTNGTGDVFVHDRETGETTRVSVGPNGVQGNNGSSQPSLSADGRYVAFLSWASNLVAGDNNGVQDVFVHDRQTGETERVSVDFAGVEANMSSSGTPRITPDGRLVVFVTMASNLVPGDTNNQQDIYVRDRQLGLSLRVSVDSARAQANSRSESPRISDDGNLVVFTSYASNLVALDQNGAADVFVHELQSGSTARVSVSSAGAQAWGGHSLYPAISSNARFIAFESGASNLVSGDTNGASDIFVRDRIAGTTTRVSVDPVGAQADSDSGEPDLSGDGNLVAFHSGATNLVAGDTKGNSDVFLYDRQTGQTARLSVDAGGNEANNHSYDVALSRNGNLAAFRSAASNLLPGDANGWDDIFARILTP